MGYKLGWIRVYKDDKGALVYLSGSGDITNRFLHKHKTLKQLEGIFSSKTAMAVYYPTAISRKEYEKLYGTETE